MARSTYSHMLHDLGGAAWFGGTLANAVALNRAAAIALRDGPAAGLRLLDELAAEPRLQDYHPFALARADLLVAVGGDGTVMEAPWDHRYPGAVPFCSLSKS